MIEGLAAMQAMDLRMACVTNKPIAFARPLLSKMGLAPYFELVYGGECLPRKKPDPMPMLQVCADFDLSPADVVAIGDSSNDAEGGARGRLLGAGRALRVQPRTVYTRSRFRWYSGFAARSGVLD